MEIVKISSVPALAISEKNGYTIITNYNGGDIARAIHKEVPAMSEEFGPNFITITDEDGNDIELEFVDALEHNGQTYLAFYPAVEEGADEDSEEYGMVILKSIMENGEELLSTLDNEEEENEVFDLFMERLFEDDEE